MFIFKLKQSAPRNSVFLFGGGGGAILFINFCGYHDTLDKYKFQKDSIYLNQKCL